MPTRANAGITLINRKTKKIVCVRLEEAATIILAVASKNWINLSTAKQSRFVLFFIASKDTETLSFYLQEACVSNMVEFPDVADAEGCLAACGNKLKCVLWCDNPFAAALVQTQTNDYVDILFYC